MQSPLTLLTNAERVSLLSQVLAIFARSKVAWPPSIVAMYRYLSAFNFNLDITGGLA